MAANFYFYTVTEYDDGSDSGIVTCQPWRNAYPTFAQAQAAVLLQVEEEEGSQQFTFACDISEDAETGEVLDASMTIDGGNYTYLIVRVTAIGG